MSSTHRTDTNTGEATLVIYAPDNKGFIRRFETKAVTGFYGTGEYILNQQVTPLTAEQVEQAFPRPKTRTALVKTAILCTEDASEESIHACTELSERFKAALQDYEWTEQNKQIFNPGTTGLLSRARDTLPAPSTLPPKIMSNPA
jgi:hypothetical protein